MNITSPQKHTLYIMGNAYDVPAGFTIMTSMEYAGFRLTRGCGCRGAICGACAVVYRVGKEQTWTAGLACQTLTQDQMTFLFLPYTQRQEHEYETSSPLASQTSTVQDFSKEEFLNEHISITVEKAYPNVTRCIQCNTCTTSCPLGLKVLGYVHALHKKDFLKVRTLSMECILCGMCAARCPRELAPFSMALMVRRLLTVHTAKPTESFLSGLQYAQDKHWQKDIAHYKNMSKEELLATYQQFQASKGGGINE